MGVAGVGECGFRIRAQGSFRNRSKKAILTAVNELKARYGFSDKSLSVMKLTLCIGKEEATFRKIIKRSGEKYNKKIPVLGLVSKTSNVVIEQLSLRKMSCRILKVEKTMAICSDTAK